MSGELGVGVSETIREHIRKMFSRFDIQEKMVIRVVKKGKGTKLVGTELVHRAH